MQDAIDGDISYGDAVSIATDVAATTVKSNPVTDATVGVAVDVARESFDTDDGLTSKDIGRIASETVGTVVGGLIGGLLTRSKTGAAIGAELGKSLAGQAPATPAERGYLSEGFRDGGLNFGGERSNPIILALETNNVEITELSQSQVFFDSDGDGLKNRTAWAAAGNGVLFYDPEGWNEIQEDWQYIFTEWDPSAASDIEALASYFDANGDGVFDANDPEFSKFKVMVTLDDGSTVVRTLDQAGVETINVVADTTRIELPDGSVITGQTMFTKTAAAGGGTGMVGDVTLAGDAASYRVEVEQDTTDANGIRTLVQEAYNADGSIAFTMTSVAAGDGSHTENSYDDDGDGIVDRVQVIEVSAGTGGARVEDVRNYSGASVTGGVFENRTKTTVSTDGKLTVIERDSMGGGWFDQREEREINGSGKQTITVSDLAEDGSVLQAVTSVTSADGLTRTDKADLDGDGDPDAVEQHNIVEHADGSRSETWLTGNGNYGPSSTTKPGTLASSVTMDVSADGRHRETETDFDGNGPVDRKEVSDTTVNADGTTVTLSESFNRDGDLISRNRQTQSEDTMHVVTEIDADGEGGYETKVVDNTSVDGSGVRTQTVSTYNKDGSLRHAEKTLLEDDKITSKAWADGNQDGSFASNERVRDVQVDAATQNRITETWDRNADGSISAYSQTTTSEDGLRSDVLTDLDGDGDTDLKLSDHTKTLANGNTERVVQTKSASNATLSEVTTETRDTGLHSTTWNDRDGDGVTDFKTIEYISPEADGSTLHNIRVFSEDGTLLSKTITTESADRRTATTEYDYDGDSAGGGTQFDRVVTQAEDASGAITVTDQRFYNDGTPASKTVSTVSADGLVRTVSTDSNGDGTDETVEEATTTLHSDGRRTVDAIVSNADGSLRSQSFETVSVNGREMLVKRDDDGDGEFESALRTTTEFLANGQSVTSVQLEDAQGNKLSKTQTRVDADGLRTVVKINEDGDNDFDLIETTETAIWNDGTTVSTVTVTDAGGDPRSETKITTSDDGREVTTDFDLDGNGGTDRREHAVEADDGVVTRTVTGFGANEADIQSRTVTATSANGLVSQTESDADGDGAFERVYRTETKLNTDGSTETTTVSGTIAADPSQGFAKDVVITSGDGLTITTKTDLNNDGTFERRTTVSEELAGNGDVTLTTEVEAANNSTILSEEVKTTADGKTVTTGFDADGNGELDAKTTATLGDDGTRTATTVYYADSGVQISEAEESVSGDGLRSSYSFDSNGDGFADLHSSSETELGEDGSRTTVTEHREGNFSSIGREEYWVSDDGHERRSELDLDGDGISEFRSTDATSYGADGSTSRFAETIGSTHTRTSSVESTLSGNGLLFSEKTDMDGDSHDDRHELRSDRAGGGSTWEALEFSNGGDLQRQVTVETADDERSQITEIDRDGDGQADQSLEWRLESDNSTTRVSRDLGRYGSVEAEVRSSTSASGMVQMAEFDQDGDGSTDFERRVEVSFSGDGSIPLAGAIGTSFSTERPANKAGDRVTEISEITGGRDTYKEVVVEAADGLSAHSYFDIDGDGVFDGEADLFGAGSRFKIDVFLKTVRNLMQGDGAVSVVLSGIESLWQIASCDAQVTRRYWRMPLADVSPHSDRKALIGVITNFCTAAGMRPPSEEDLVDRLVQSCHSCSAQHSFKVTTVGGSCSNSGQTAPKERCHRLL